jgi:hypothetical protein
VSDLLHDALTRGLSLVERGHAPEGLGLLTAAAGEVDADPRDYESLLEALGRAFAVTQRWRGLASIAWYKGDVSNANLFRSPPAVDVARSFRMKGDEASAARSFEDAGLLAHAAIARERANDLQGARALWSRLAHRLSSSSAVVDDAWGRGAEVEAEQSYVLGLIRYNVARNAPSSRADRSRRESIVSAVGALEEAAARFEAIGLRERAFDCYNALAAIGATTTTFEHTLEGRVNAIRILREDYLQQYALQQFDEAIAVAETAGEFAAAATFAREAMAYARSLSLVNDVQSYARRALDLHAATARAIVRADGPPELAENAMLAAIALSAELGQLAKARDLYIEASQLPGLDDARKQRHSNGAAHLQGAEDAQMRADPKSTARPPGPPLEVWIVDVLEWEQAGRAEEACADILFDAGSSARGKSIAERARDPATAPIRRRALVGRLVALDLEVAAQQPPAVSVPIAIELVRRLGEIVDYRVLSPLEALARHFSPDVRAKAVEAAGNMPFKRSAQLLRAAARDPEPRVVQSAAKSAQRKQSPVFVDPLRRLARDAPSEDVRLSALRALATIDNAEAADAVLTALEAGSAAERQTIVDALRRRRPDRASRIVQLARERVHKGVSVEVARDLESALGSLQ